MHFYHKDGTPCYQVENKSRGGMRPSTLADAKKLGLLPSVSEILKIVYSGGLQNWIKNQIVEAAWNIPWEICGKATKEAHDAWVEAVLVKADEISRTAADKGSDIHDAIEKWFKSESVPKYEAWQHTFSQWWLEHWVNHIEVQNEGYIKTDYGYGGRFDILVTTPDTRIIIDLKTQNTKGKSFNFYRSWGRQLAAYAQALDCKRLISVAIDSQDPAKIESYEWTDYDVLLQEFECARRLWCSENNFNYRKGE